MGKNSRGVTLIELMLAGTLIVVASLVFVASFDKIARAIKHSRTKSLAVIPLALEKMETLRQTPYSRLAVTTATAQALEPGLGAFSYDTAAYPSELITIGGTAYTRRTYIEKVQDSDGKLVPVSSALPDTGAKRLTVYITWNQEGSWQKYQTTSLYTNPAFSGYTAALSGRVTDGGITPVAGARVEVLQNMSMFAIADEAGNYQLKAAPGMYTLRAAANGYFSQYVSSVTISSAVSGVQNFSLAAMAAGTVSGDVWLATRPVISMVVASSGSINGTDAEFVELYNPSTAAFAVNFASLRLYYQQSGGGTPNEIALDYLNGFIPAQGYYLVASVPQVSVAGYTKTADAVYAVTAERIANSSDGGVGIMNPQTGQYYDRVAWRNTAGPNAPAALTEGEAVPLAGGLAANAQLVRMTCPGALSSSYGRGYDSDANSLNFYQYSPVSTPVKNSEDSQVPLCGVPAYGAVVSANDGLSSAVQAVASIKPGGFAAASFSLPDVATGTWSLTAASGSYYTFMDSVTVTAGNTVSVPNASTLPPWQLAGVYAVQLASSSDSGFVSGRVTNIYNTPMQNITISAGGGTVRTNAAGRYLLGVPAGFANVSANPSGAAGYSAYYASISSQGVAVTAGQITSDIDFTLPNAGSITGWVTINGTDPLPNVPVTAVSNGVEAGFTLTDTNGYFALQNIYSGTYIVGPQLDSSETAVPSTATVSLFVPGSTVWSATFTVTNTMSVIKGTVREGGRVVTDGALIFASTATLAANPPVNNAALRNSGIIYYADSTMLNGTYSLAVRGGSAALTYYVYAFRNGVRKSATVSVPEGNAVTVDFDF